MPEIPGGLLVGLAPFALIILIGKGEANLFPEYHQSKQPLTPSCIIYNDVSNCTQRYPNYAQKQ